MTLYFMSFAETPRNASDTGWVDLGSTNFPFLVGSARLHCALQEARCDTSVVIELLDKANTSAGPAGIAGGVIKRVRAMYQSAF